MASPIVGEEWVYEPPGTARLERVRIVGIPDVHPARYDILMLTGYDAGEQVRTPPRRLQVPWQDVAEYAQQQENWRRVEAIQVTEPQARAIGKAFELCIPYEVADPYHTLRAPGVTAVFDPAALTTITGLTLVQLTSGIDWLEEDALVVSADGGLRIAEAACQRNADLVLDWVHKDEEERREACRRWPTTNREGEGRDDPEEAWLIYVEYDRHVHELLRQWCGYQAIADRERLLATEAEAHRLDALLARCIELLKTSQPMLADDIARERRAARITPGSFRPIVERPQPPPIVEYRTRRWPR